MQTPLREMIGRGITAPNALISRSTDTSATDHAAPCGYGPGPIVIDGGVWPAFTDLLETTRPDSSRRRSEATLRNRAPKSCVHRLKILSRETPVTRNRYMFAAEVAVRGISLSSSRTPSVALCESRTSSSWAKTGEASKRPASTSPNKWSNARAFSLLNRHDRGHRGNAVSVYQEEHVVPRGREILVRWHRHVEPVPSH